MFMRPTNVKYALSAILVPRWLQQATQHGTNGPQNIVPSMALVPNAWSYARAPFHTGKRAVDAPMGKRQNSEHNPPGRKILREK